MIRRLAILVGVSVAVTVVVAVPLGLWRGEYQWWCAGVAARGSVVPPGVIALFVAEPAGANVSPWTVAGRSRSVHSDGCWWGSAVRLLVFLLSKPTFHADPISFFGWVLGAYLMTLVTETVLLARKSKRAGGERGCRGNDRAFLFLPRSFGNRSGGGDGEEDRPIQPRRR